MDKLFSLKMRELETFKVSEDASVRKELPNILSSKVEQLLLNRMTPY